MKNTILKISIPLLLFVSCGADAPNQYTYRPPVNINDGFDVGSLNEVNIDSELIEKAVSKILSGKYSEVHSILLFKDKKLIFEEYFMGHEFKWDGPDHHGALVTWNRDKGHIIMSVGKSITSACIGIAIDKGFIKSVHQSIFDYLPNYQHLNTDGKDKITIKHMLTMTSGLEWDEWGAPSTSKDNDAFMLWFQKDPIMYVLEKPMRKNPGTSFAYSGGNMIVLGEIIQNATKMNIEEFSEQYLFAPLGIASIEWRQFENGAIDASGGFKMKPRDMAKIGVLFLNKGVWNGTRIIPEQWVKKSATPFSGNHNINVPGEDSGRNGYSYSWWIKTVSKSGKGIHMYSAGGWGGQHIMVLPELNTVVVFSGGNYVTYRPPFKILEEYILPSIN